MGFEGQEPRANADNGRSAKSSDVTTAVGFVRSPEESLRLALMRLEFLEIYAATITSYVRSALAEITGGEKP